MELDVSYKQLTLKPSHALYLYAMGAKYTRSQWFKGKLILYCVSFYEIQSFGLYFMNIQRPKLDHMLIWYRRVISSLIC